MRFRSAVVGLTALGILAGFQSCRPVRSEQVKSQGNESGALSQKVSSNLKIGFYLAEEGGSVPDFDHPAASRNSMAKLMEGMIRDGEAIQLRNRVPMGPEKLFLAISDVLGSRRIIDASYEHRTVSSKNATQGESHRMLLSYDRDQHQYFLALDDLAKTSRESLSSLDLQVLSFNLTLNDGTTSQCEVRFYLKPELPSAEEIRVSQVFSKSRVFGASASPKEGWTFLKESYKNPTAQPLFLWFSSAGVSYQLETRLGVKLDWKLGENLTLIPEARPHTEDGFEPDLHRYSRVPLENVSLMFFDPKSNQPQHLALSKLVSLPVEILPGQTLEVEWHLTASKQVPSCQAGSTTSRTFWPCNAQGPEALSRTAGCAPPEGPWVPENLKKPVRFDGIWAVQSSHLAGEFRGKVQVTEEIGTQTSLLSRAESDGLALSIATSFAVSSDIPTGAEMDSCQGIY